jgi:hypothetical protein
MEEREREGEIIKDIETGKRGEGEREKMKNRGRERERERKRECAKWHERHCFPFSIVWSKTTFESVVLPL